MRRLLLLTGVVPLLGSVFVLSVFVALSCGGDKAEAHWVITDLGAGIASDLNERGQVVGGGAFIWQDGEKKHLGTLGGPSSRRGWWWSNRRNSGTPCSGP